MERVSLLIDDKEFATWQSIRISLALDTISCVRFTTPFDPARREIRETFRPFSYRSLKVKVGGALIFGGTMVDVAPSVDANASVLEVSGYALPGVLQDCCAPGDRVPHEYRNLTLHAIAQQLCGLFGLRMKVECPPGKRFDKVKLTEETEIFGFLAELARQRNQVISNTKDGALLFQQSVDPGDPVAVLVEGEAPVSRVVSQFSPQQCFSELTGFAATRRGRRGGKHTVRNPWFNGFRPLSFRCEDTATADVPEATRARLGRMFGNMASWTLEDLPTWRDPGGQIWAPNTTVKLTAPGAMIYRRTELLVRTVELEQTATKEWAVLGLMLPGAFSGKAPQFLPWEDPI